MVDYKVELKCFEDPDNGKTLVCITTARKIANSEALAIRDKLEPVFADASNLQFVWNVES